LGVGLTTPHRKKQIRYEKDQLRSYLNEKVTAPVCKTEINGRAESRADHTTPFYLEKLPLKYADQRRLLSWYNFAC
jgi:hypothetical protein